MLMARSRVGPGSDDLGHAPGQEKRKAHEDKPPRGHRTLAAISEPGGDPYAQQDEATDVEEVPVERRRVEADLAPGAVVLVGGGSGLHYRAPRGRH